MDIGTGSRKQDIYQLKGIVVHSGTAFAGHYYSYIQVAPCNIARDACHVRRALLQVADVVYNLCALGCRNHLMGDPVGRQGMFVHSGRRRPESDCASTKLTL